MRRTPVQHSLLFGFSVYLSFLQSISAETSSFHELSPVYEEMLGNQVDQLRRELARNGFVDEREAFWVAGWDRESRVLAFGVTRSLSQKRATFKNWRFAEALPARDFRGVIFFMFNTAQMTEESKAEMKEAIRFMANGQHVGFLMIIAPKEFDHSLLETMIGASGLRISDVIPERELEFVKDASGRQIINLDGDRFRLKVYERLVREGMNPVYAMPASGEAIHRFRTDGNGTILVVERS
ncbi:MAG: hypothetical protein A3G87_04500 [Omnitrophica bacterium RIFCSPLOWO2_12_FULL_50_11]|nr:MAG: hypothetical protein A3G87_04500 [Omnitrophica bacterium RIFCSPLOWO2_12_FULL_50_11]